MEMLEELVLPGWMTVDEASTTLDVSRQAVMQAAVRAQFSRRRIADVLLLSRTDVERYARERRPTGPRRRRPAEAAGQP